MALSSIAITTLAKAKNWLGITTTTASALKVYHDGTGSPATAQVSVTPTTLFLDSATGAQDQTRTFADATDDTLAELVANILPANGWIATLLYPGDASSTDLVPMTAVSCLLQANEQTLTIMDNRPLELIIEGVTAEIENFLGRGIVSRTYTEDVYLEPGEPLEGFCLAEPDVAAVEAIRIDTLHALTVTYTGAEVRATVQVTETAVIQKHGSTTTTTLFTAATTLTAMETAMEAAGAGWTVTIPASISGSTPSALLARSPGRSCKSVNVQLNAWEDYDGDYVVNYDPGVVSIGNWTWPYSSRDPVCCMPSRVQVAYTAGFATVPYDVEQVALQMIADAYNGKGRDTRLQSESLDGYSYTYSAGALEQAPDWQKRLSKYQRMLP